MSKPRSVDELSRHLEALETRGADLHVDELIAESTAIAADLQRLGNARTTPEELRQHAQLARLMRDEAGKVFTNAVTDQVFRATDTGRVADQLVHLLDRYGVPRYFSGWERLQLTAFRTVGPMAPSLTVPAVTARIRGEMNSVIVPGESAALGRYLAGRANEGVEVNLNVLGEAILGEDEAEARVQSYLDALARPDVGCVSVKISSVASQLEPLAFDDTLTMLTGRLRRLFLAAAAGERQKLLYLDMESYDDLQLTVAAFTAALDAPDLQQCRGGIVLQAYIPDSHDVQHDLTEWALRRVAAGGSPIRVRLVKGANLKMEQLEATHHGWPQAPYTSKADVDASFKRMVLYGTPAERAAAVNLGIASHNVFDVAFAMVLRAVRGTCEHVGFEMLEGMADGLRRTVQELSGNVLVYGPAVREEEIQSAIAYLIRRLDENTDPENFLRHAFGLEPDTEAWRDQERRFVDSVRSYTEVRTAPRRSQDRRAPAEAPEGLERAFVNEPDTDWSIAHNREHILQLLEGRRSAPPEHVPCQIAGELLDDAGDARGRGADPSRPGVVAYTCALASWDQVDRALDTAVAAGASWAARSPADRADVLARCAHALREARCDLIAVMTLDGGKAVRQSDPEISEAVDFAEYYLRSGLELFAHEDIAVSPRGVVLVTPPWNFPLAIPASGVLAALAAGNSVILKPAPQAVLTGWHLARLLWDAGVPRDVLQFIVAADDPVGSQLVRDERVASIVLTGGTDTARLFQRLRPGLHLLAETGGKNAMLITSMADLDLAIKHAVYSAFGHSGQKCSATSLLICEAAVYDDHAFRERLADAVRSLHVGSAWDPSSKITPLIEPPTGKLLEALTSIDDGEHWLVEPRVDPDNPALWSPGVKMDVAPGSTTHLTEFFGPVLGVMRAESLDEALTLANATDYGLTAGLQSLDDREQERWLAAMNAGNLYVNRPTTGAIVQRQPFGGRKASGFGPGAKAGGPNYVAQLALLAQVSLPGEADEPQGPLAAVLARMLDGAPEDERAALTAAAGSYARAWRTHFSVAHDPARLLGQDNLFRYQPVDALVVRLAAGWDPQHAARALLAATACGVVPELSVDPGAGDADRWAHAAHGWHVTTETASEMAARLTDHAYDRVRVIGAEEPALRDAAAAAGVTWLADEPLLNGALELPRYLLEQSCSIDYHRYGNEGDRRGESRTGPARLPGDP